MTEQFEVDQAEVSAVAGALADTGTAMRQVALTLGEQIDAAGQPWGNDAIGEQIAQVVAHLHQTLQAMKDQSDRVDALADYLFAAPGIFAASDQA